MSDVTAESLTIDEVFAESFGQPIKESKMTDDLLMRTLKAIDNLTQAANEMVQVIEKSDHPDAKEVAKTLRENGFDNTAWAAHCWSPK